jgi:FtsH-binding integral membrane protein
MSDMGNYTGAAGAGALEATDPGLRKFMLGVYQKMGLGLVVSAVLAWITSSYAPVTDLLFVRSASGALAGFTLLGLIISFAPIVIILGSNFLMQKASPRAANLLFWVIVALIGASLGTLVLMYSGASIASTFMVTAASFGGLSLIGYTTKKNLSGLRSFCIFAMWGLVFAFILAIFAPALGAAFGTFSTGPLFWIMNGAGILLMAGLIASETQHLKMIYYSVRGDEAGMNAATSYGALQLYIAFVNLFRFLLYFLGGRRD